MAIQLLSSAEVSTTLKIGTTAAIGSPLYAAPNFGLTPNLIVATPVEPVPNSSPGVLQLMCLDGTVSAGQEIGRVQFAHKDDATSGYANSYIRSVNQNSAGTGSSGGGNLRFGTASTSSGNSPQDRMTIRYNGNVGVGTLTPSAKFQVSGDMEVEDAGDRGFYIDPSVGEFEIGDIKLPVLLPSGLTVWYSFISFLGSNDWVVSVVIGENLGVYVQPPSDEKEPDDIEPVPGDIKS